MRKVNKDTEEIIRGADIPKGIAEQTSNTKEETGTQEGRS